MKKIIGVFIVVLISLGVAEMLTGVILTVIYTPNLYSQSGQEMATDLQYIISAITVTFALWSIHKLNSLVKNARSTVETS